MSRLTDTEYGAYCAYANTIDCDDCNSCKWSQAIFDKLAHYEDLEEAGRLIEIPCKVGDTVYAVNHYECYIVEFEVAKVWCDKFDWWISTGDFMPCFNFRQFGEILFLTKAEAEAKLAELKEGGE